MTVTFARGYFTVPDMVVVALMGLLAVYGLFSLVLGERNIVMRVLGGITSPVRVPVAVLTPRLMPRFVVALFAIACLYVIRIAFFIASQAIR